MSEREKTHDAPQGSTFAAAGTRGRDDRRGLVKPSESPAPISPPPDAEAIRKGEEILARVKAY